MEPADLIWMNGEFVAWEDAKVHVLTHGLHYGTGRLRGRPLLRHRVGPAVFRHADHIDRLFKSAELYYMPIPFDREQLRAVDARADRQATACARATSARSCSAATGTMGLFPLDAPVDVCVAVWEWGAYLGEEGKTNGVRAKVSTWRRISPDSLIPHAKAIGPVPQLVLAKIESHKAGYEEAILLDDNGHVCEGSGENIFVVRDGVIYTPPQTASILDGINRKSAIQIARDLGFEVVERDIARAELYLADEIFMTGTAAELVPCVEVDDHAIGAGKPGEVTRAVQKAFDDALHGRDRALPRVAGPGPGPAPRSRDPALRRHPARRHAGRGHVAHRRREAARRPQARRARHPPHRGRLPGVEPQGARALRAARAASASSTRRSPRSG